MKRAIMSGAMLLALSLPVLWAGDGFDGIFDEPAEETTVDRSAAEADTRAIVISGEIGLDLGYFFDNGWESESIARPFALLRGEVRSGAAVGTVVFEIQADDPLAPSDSSVMIDELSLRIFLPFGFIDAGLLKVEWGKGDGIHVIDPLNPLDRSDGRVTGLLDMKIAEAMVRLGFYLGGNGLIELVYLPFFHPDVFAAEGRWTVIDMSSFPSAGAIVSPDTRSLMYSRAAARITGTIGPADLGLLYYFGFMGEPGFRFTTTFTGTDPYDPSHYTTATDIVYTRAHLFGVEGAWAAGPFTFRTEVGYWLTEDREGTIPERYNDRLVYLGGADVMIPGTDIYLSIQVAGKYIVGFDGTDASDVDAMSAFGTPYTNTVIGALEIPSRDGKFKLRIGGLYLVEGEGYAIFPDLTWTIRDDVELITGVRIYGGADVANNPYHAWDGNDSAGIVIRYVF